MTPVLWVHCTTRAPVGEASSRLRQGRTTLGCGKDVESLLAVKQKKADRNLVCCQSKVLVSWGRRMMACESWYIKSTLWRYNWFNSFEYQYTIVAGAGLLLCCVVAAATVGSWAPRVSHKASAAVTIAAVVLWFQEPTASLMEGGRRIKNIDKKRSVSGLTPWGRCCLNFPMRMLGLRPCIAFPKGDKATQNTTATYFFPTAPAKDQRRSKIRLHNTFISVTWLCIGITEYNMYRRYLVVQMIGHMMLRWFQPASRQKKY